MKKATLALAVALIVAVLLSGCGPKTVYVYTDQPKADVEKLIAPYLEKGGDKVEVLSFSRSEDLLKALGAAQQDDRGRRNDATPSPGATANSKPADLVLTGDLFTIAQLKLGKALLQYIPANATGLPSGAKGQGYWYGLGGKGWVIAYNTDLVKDSKKADSYKDLTDDIYPNKAVGIPNVEQFPYYPLSIFALMGSDYTANFFQTLIFKETSMTSSLDKVANDIASGAMYAGVTPYSLAKEKKDGGSPVDFIFPDNQAGDIGSYVQFYSVGIIATSKYVSGAQKLEEYLLTPEAEALSVKLGLSDVTLRDNSIGVPVVRPLNIPPDKVLAAGEEAQSAFENMGR